MLYPPRSHGTRGPDTLGGDAKARATRHGWLTGGVSSRGRAGHPRRDGTGGKLVLGHSDQLCTRVGWDDVTPSCFGRLCCFIARNFVRRRRRRRRAATLLQQHQRRRRRPTAGTVASTAAINAFTVRPSVRRHVLLTAAAVARLSIRRLRPPATTPLSTVRP